MNQNLIFFKKKLIIWTIITGLLSACSADADDAPKNLISKDKMATILAEIHLKESEINNLSLANGDTNFFIFKTFEAEVFKRNKVDSSTYAASYNYYLVNPKEFIAMYNLVVDNIKEQNKLDSLAALKNRTQYKASDKVENDSLKKINASSMRNSALKQKLDSVRSKMIHGK